MQTRKIVAFYRPGLMTLLIIAINLLVYGAMLWQGSDPTGSEDIIGWGGSFAPHLLAGQWWRMISSQFVHFGLMHLAMNMFILYNIGLILEKFLGKGKLILAYLLTGVGASFASLWWYRNEDVVSAGASGAIFGLYGVYIAILTTRLIPFHKRGPLLSSALTFVGYNIVFGFEPGVDNAAHLGGLISGLILGYSLYPILRSPILSRIIGKLALAASFATLIGCGILLFANIQNPPNLANQDARIFYDLADRLLDRESELTEKAEKLEPGDAKLLSSEIIPGWKEALSLTYEMQELELNEEDTKYRDFLTQWVQLIIQRYETYLNGLTMRPVGS